MGLKRMEMASKPKSLSGKQVSQTGLGFVAGNADASLNGETGLGGHWAGEADCVVG